MGLDVYSTALFINIDFEKVYDRVKWPFSLAMLKDLGFGPSFINIVETLFSNVSSCLSIN